MSDAWIERFKKEAVPILVSEFAPDRVLLFGSRIDGNPNRDSDIDVLIISRKFEDVPFLRRMSLVRRKVRFPKHVDYLCYTPREYEKIRHESVVVMEATERGVSVA